MSFRVFLSVLVSSFNQHQPKSKKTMKKTLLTLLWMGLSFISATAQLATYDEVIEGTITSNRTLTANKKYLLKGFVNVNAPAVLTIEPGTLIYGDQETKGALIINRGAKINANGTAQRPIVFTSQKAIGQRAAGDWGGIIIAGRASLNIPGGVATLEGGTNTQYGGGTSPDDNDNSGVLRYVRVEFSGIPFQPNNEINGITLGAVGRGTVIEYVQVSYNGDDSWEWFGGTVNAKYIISAYCVDDDFDTDNGFNGNIQFALSVRHPQIADVSGSNGFESDNDASGSLNSPRTAATFSNVTMIGPKALSTTEINSLYRNAQQIRRSSLTSTYNSVIMGWPTNGILVDGANTTTAAKDGLMEVRSTAIAGAATPFTSNQASIFNPIVWRTDSQFGNSVFANNEEVKLANPFRLNAPDPKPLVDSPVNYAGNFSISRINNAFFERVSYMGAFSPTAARWDAGWANYNPQNTDYSKGIPTSIDEDPSLPFGYTLEQNYPNPFNPSTTIGFTLAKSEQVSLTVYDLMGREVATLMNNEQRPAGYNSIVFNALNLSSGVYFYTLSTNTVKLTQKMSLIK
jgi:hypothetical protein